MPPSTPLEPFTLPTEAGVRFGATGKVTRARVAFTTIIGLDVPVYALNGDPDYVYVKGAVLEHYENLRLLPAADKDGGDK